ncbi:MAG: transposase [bacterium]
MVISEAINGRQRPKNILGLIAIIVARFPPKYAISEVVGFLKWKSAIKIFDIYSELKKRYWGRHFLVKEYCVGTIGLDDEQIRKYLRW